MEIKFVNKSSGDVSVEERDSGFLITVRDKDGSVFIEQFIAKLFKSSDKASFKESIEERFGLKFRIQRDDRFVDGPGKFFSSASSEVAAD